MHIFGYLGTSLDIPKDERLDEGGAELDILDKASSPSTWLEYDPSMRLTKFTKVHMRVGPDKNLTLLVDQYDALVNVV